MVVPDVIAFPESYDVRTNVESPRLQRQCLLHELPGDGLTTAGPALQQGTSLRETKLVKLVELAEHLGRKLAAQKNRSTPPATT